MWMHARASHFTKSRCDPWVNLLRSTVESFAAVVGGADAVRTSPFDEAIGPPDSFARHLARNTQLVLREETRLHRVTDPAGGSYYIERLSDELARAAWAEFQGIVRRGGMARELRRGRVRDAVQAESRRRAESIARRQTPWVGVSEYPNLEESTLERSLPDTQEVEGAIGRTFGSADPQARYEALLTFARLVAGHEAGAPGRLAGSAIEAAESGVDVFSMGSVLRTGKASLHVEPVPSWRGAEPWERLRDASATYARIRGRRPRAFLVNLGPIPEHRLRAEFAHHLLSAGGIEPLPNDGYDSVDDAVEAFGTSGGDLAVVCGTDARYVQDVPTLVPRLKERGAATVVLCGPPGDKEDEFREAGVNHFVYRGANALAVLETLHDELGVSV
jgi:methylmalonyl-CoA mutase